MRIILVFHWNLNRFLCKHDLYRLSIHWVRKWCRMLKVCKIEPGSRNMNLIWNWFINVSQKYNLVLIWILYIFSQALLLEEIFYCSEQHLYNLKTFRRSNDDNMKNVVFRIWLWSRKNSGLPKAWSRCEDEMEK